MSNNLLITTFTSVPADDGFHYDSNKQLIWFQNDLGQCVAACVINDFYYPLLNSDDSCIFVEPAYGPVDCDVPAYGPADCVVPASQHEAYEEYLLEQLNSLRVLRKKKSLPNVDINVDITRSLRSFENDQTLRAFIALSFKQHTEVDHEIILVFCLILSQIPFMKKTMLSFHKSAYTKGQNFFPTCEDMITRLIPVLQFISRAWLNVVDNETTSEERKSFLTTVFTPLVDRFKQAGGNPDSDNKSERCFRLNNDADNKDFAIGWLGLKRNAKPDSTDYNTKWDTYARIVSVCMPGLLAVSKACVQEDDLSVVCNSYF